MKIVERYSHLNGHEWLLVHRPDIWQEIEAVVHDLDAETCRTKVSHEIRTLDKVLYSPVAMNRRFKELFGACGWKESRTSYWVTSDMSLIRDTLHRPRGEQRRMIEAAGRTPIWPYNQTDFTKGRVSVEVQFGKYSFIAYDLFVKHLAFYVGDLIDVGVEILPMKTLQSEMSSGVGYYEGALYDVGRQGRGSPAVPLVMVGVEA